MNIPSASASPQITMVIIETGDDQELKQWRSKFFRLALRRKIAKHRDEVSGICGSQSLSSLDRAAFPGCLMPYFSFQGCRHG